MVTDENYQAVYNWVQDLDGAFPDRKDVAVLLSALASEPSPDPDEVLHLVQGLDELALMIELSEQVAEIDRLNVVHMLRDAAAVIRRLRDERTNR